MYRSPFRSNHTAQRGTGSRGSRARLVRAVLSLLPTALLALTCGCESPLNHSGMTNSYYLNPYKDLNTLGRVALVEFDNNSSYPNISTDMTSALFVALQKKQIFGLTIVRQDAPEWRGLQENIDSLQALKKLLAMRETLKCNGLLVATITEYQPYPRLAIGLRLKLLDLTDGQLLWGLEQVWDTADKSIEKRIKQYFKDELRSSVASLREELVVISSLRFTKFIAYEVAQTLNRDEE